MNQQTKILIAVNGSACRDAAALVVALQLLAVWWPPLTRVLRTAAPNATDWAIIGLAVLTPIVIVEITKFIARRTAIKT